MAWVAGFSPARRERCNKAAFRATERNLTNRMPPPPLPPHLIDGAASQQPFPSGQQPRTAIAAAQGAGGPQAPPPCVPLVLPDQLDIPAKAAQVSHHLPAMEGGVELMRREATALRSGNSSACAARDETLHMPRQSHAEQQVPLRHARRGMSLADAACCHNHALWGQQPPKWRMKQTHQRGKALRTTRRKGWSVPAC